MRSIFAQIANPHSVITAAGLHGLGSACLNTIVRAVAPIAGACVAAGVLANIAQIGWRPSLHPLKPDFERINPAAGVENVFGPRIVFETAKALAKVGVVGAVAAMALIPQISTSARAWARRRPASGRW